MSEEEFGFWMDETTQVQDLNTPLPVAKKAKQLSLQNKKNLGITTFCLIPDKILLEREGGKYHRFFREVDYGLSGSIINPASDKGWKLPIQVPDIRDFKCSLSKEQKDCITHLRSLGKQFAQLTDFKHKNQFPDVWRLVSCKISSLQFFTFGKILRQSLKTGECKDNVGQICVLTFDKGARGTADFGSVFNNAIKTKDLNMPNKSWQFNYFGRKAGEKNHCVCVNSDTHTDVNGVRYSLGISFDECIPFDITEDELILAENLDQRVYNIESFDDDYYHRLTAAFDYVEGEVHSYLATLAESPKPVIPPPEKQGPSNVTKMEDNSPSPDFSTDNEEYPF